jgi:hypothetical protein
MRRDFARIGDDVRLAEKVAGRDTTIGSLSVPSCPLNPGSPAVTDSPRTSQDGTGNSNAGNFGFPPGGDRK